MGAMKILVTGSRGGCGKSSVAAGLAVAMAERGEKVVLIDLDLSERSLDMYLGCEDRVVYDLGDLLTGQRSVRDVAVRPDGFDRLYLIPGAYHLRRPPTQTEFARILSAAEGELGATRIIVDTSNAADPSVKLGAALCDRAVMVVTDGYLSMRSAASLADTLHEWGMDDPEMVVNRFSMDPKHPTDLRNVIDTTGLRLIGVLPDIPPFARMQDAGTPAIRCREAAPVATAFANIARRLEGENCPLLTGIPCKRRKLLDI